MLPIVLVMGASSSGKSTVAKQLADYMNLSSQEFNIALQGATYLEADDLHSEANVSKMTKGLPLDDNDRFPWLKAISECLRKRSKAIILACSSLKKKYRDILRNGYGNEMFKIVFLRVGLGELRRRIGARYEEGNHFMPPTMVESQLNDLEEPGEEETPIVIEADKPLGMVVQEAIVQLKKWRSSNE